MYEMLTGRVPFDADTPVSVALKHMQEEPKAPKELNDKIPSSVNEIILKAMRKDTNLRYQSATEMLRDLNNALKNPEGDFVDNKEYQSDMATKKISIKDIQEEANRSKNNKKENKFKKFIKNHKGLSFFICLILLFILSLGGTIAVSRLTEPKEVVLPNFVGVNINEAKKIAEEKKLKIEVSSEEYNGQYQEGQIISQDPLYSENYNIKMGTTIKVVVSKGIEQAIVPRVIGIPEEEAIKAIEEAKLKVQKVEEENKKIEAGYVISQETEPESKVLAGDTVVIHVSTGVKKVAVPSVIGQNEEEAKKTLSDLGFSVKTVNDEDSSKDNGIVLKQSLDVDKEVEVGTSITLTVNKLTEEKTVSLTVNLKSLLNGDIYETVKKNNNTSENETNSSISEDENKTVKKVAVKITVDYNEI